MCGKWWDNREVSDGVSCADRNDRGRLRRDDLSQAAPDSLVTCLCPYPCPCPWAAAAGWADLDAGAAEADCAVAGPANPCAAAGSSHWAVAVSSPARSWAADGWYRSFPFGRLGLDDQLEASFPRGRPCRSSGSSRCASGSGPEADWLLLELRSCRADAPRP